MDSKTLRSGQCPACDSKEVYCDDNYSTSRGRSWNSVILKHILGFHVLAAVQTYVCASCGYVERYISNSKDLDQVKSNWRRVGDKEKRKRGDS